MQPSKYRGIRMPPNMTKIFNYWGMRDKVGDIGVVTERIVMSRRTRDPPLMFFLSSQLIGPPYPRIVETAYLLGAHCWEHEMLEEAGGEFIALYVRAPGLDRPMTLLTFSCPIQHSHLRRMLLETAHELGAKTRTNAEVVQIAEDCRSLRLATGEVIEADIIIGADGSQGMCRRLVVSQDPPKATGVTLFKYAFRTLLLPPLRLFFPLFLTTTINQFRNIGRPHPCRPRAAYVGGTRAGEYDLYVRKGRSKLLSSKVSQWAWFGHESCSVCFPVVGGCVSH